MNHYCTVAQFRAYFKSPAEFVVIDPRSPQDFESGHILAATNLPLSVLRSGARRRIPSLNTAIIICSDDLELNLSAAVFLKSIDYIDIHILEQGFDAWRKTGGALFSGLHVPGKSFGEFIDHHCKTPVINVDDFLGLIENQQSFLLLDSRTREEHTSYCIPGSILCSSTELLYRVNVDHEDLIIVHCGGRTRSIIGAQTLIDAGYKNVFAFENGTMAWQAKNLPLEVGNQKMLPLLDKQDLIENRNRIDALAARKNISRINQVPESTRTQYLIDIRSESEYHQGHLIGSINVPGGQLVQAVDYFIPVRNAEIILIDSDQIRATTTAIWLLRMGIVNIKVLSINVEHTLIIDNHVEIEDSNSDRALNPNDYSDPNLLIEQNRKYLEWEIALFKQIKGDPVANQFSVD
jgi:rhodanese-related sulfurtransferase